jgi:hypothetical protein
MWNIPKPSFTVSFISVIGRRDERGLELSNTPISYRSLVGDDGPGSPPNGEPIAIEDYTLSPIIIRFDSGLVDLHPPMSGANGSVKKLHLLFFKC